MKKIIGLALIICMITSGASGVLAEVEESPDSSSVTTTDTASPTEQNTATETAQSATKSSIDEFFICMQNGSNFAYVNDGNGIKLVPMITYKTDDVVSPTIIDGWTYLPLRYLLEDKLGFSDVSEKQSENKNIFSVKMDGDDITIDIKTNTTTTTLSTKENKELITLNDNKEKKQDEIIGIKKVGGTSYVPLRLFDEQNMNLCSIDYDRSRGYIFMGSNKDFVDQYKNIVLEGANTSQKYRNNFMSYSDIVSIDGKEATSISNVINGSARSASNNSNLVTYTMENDKVYYLEGISDNDNKLEQLEIYQGKDNILDILVNRPLIYGDRIYGISVSEGGRRRGELFTAKLQPYVSNDDAGNKIHKIRAIDYKKISIGEDIIAYSLQEETNADDASIIPFIYYFDGANDTLTKFDIRALNGDDDIHSQSYQIENMDYFTIGGDYLVYYDYVDKKIKYAAINQNDIGEIIGEIKEIPNFAAESIQFIIYDYDNKRYCYIDTSGEPNKIMSFTIDKDGIVTEPQVFCEGTKIRNISSIKGKIYANVNDTSRECEQGGKYIQD